MNSLSTNTTPQRHKLKFHGSGETWLGIWLVNILLTVVTFGIYSAWAKVRTRRYFYGNTELAGDRFDYHAKPTQLLLGRVLVIMGLMVFYFAVGTAPTLATLLVLAFVALLPWIIVRNWRFEAIMSSYRGVRFNYHCHVGRAYMTFLVWPLLAYLALAMVIGMSYGIIASGFQMMAVVVAALLIPGFIAVNGVLSAVQHDLYVNNLFFGDSAFSGKMKKAAFVKFAMVAVLLALPFLVLIVMALGSFIYDMALMSQFGADGEAIGSVVLANTSKIILVYFLLLVWGMMARAYLTVAHRNYMFNHTRLDQGKIAFHSTMKLLPYVWLLFVNALIVLFSLGLATPFAQVRHAHYLVNTLEVEGDIDTLTVQAHTDTAQSAVAEELVQALDLNVGI